MMERFSATHALIESIEATNMQGSVEEVTDEFFNRCAPDNYRDAIRQFIGLLREITVQKMMLETAVMHLMEKRPPV